MLLGASSGQGRLSSGDMLAVRVKDLKWFMVRFFPLEKRESAYSQWFPSRL